jgi:chromate transport protein ChrA
VSSRPLRDETVRRHWLEDAELLDLFGTVSVLPGPSSTQLAIRRQELGCGRRRGRRVTAGPIMMGHTAASPDAAPARGGPLD